mmetsp:Transcript_163800/g.398105  ORF Transcript_163800/g.398105 Transcript_163800/m.398105 type:complete len:204 (-) Transcript_163800:136-747(-)
MYLRQTGRTASLSVAENIMTCLSRGVFMKIFCTSARMSMASSILSHSSRTKCLQLSSLRWPELTRSSTRPGVPITTCGASSCSSLMCCLRGTPPYSTAVLTSGRYLEKRLYSWPIWKASSRAWHSTITLTCSDGTSWCSVASTNTAVLPMPDLAWQMMSMPSSACGMHSCCTSLGCSKPQSTMARSSSGFSMKSRKPEAWMPT